jgi:hypothetical protein
VSDYHGFQPTRCHNNLVRFEKRLLEGYYEMLIVNSTMNQVENMSSVDESSGREKFALMLLSQIIT